MIQNLTGVDATNGPVALANLALHPQHYNVEGWDMGAGYDTTTVFLDPTVNGNLPAGCTFTTNGTATGANPGGWEVECTNSSSAPLVFGSYDWSEDGNASHHCVSLFINQLRTGDVTFGPQKVRMDSECSAAGASPPHNGPMWLKIQGTQANLTYNNLDCDGNARTYRGAFTYSGTSCIIDNRTGSTNLATMNHSAIHDQPSRPIVGKGGTAGHIYNNVIVDGIALDSDTAHTHGELDLFVTGQQTIANITLNNVLFRIPNNSNGGANTSPYDFSTGGPGGAHVTHAVFHRVNSFVNANRNTSPQFTSAEAFVSLAYDIVDTLDIGDSDIRNANYTWSNGAPQCTRMPSRTSAMSGYILNNVLYVLTETGPVNAVAPTGPIMVGESVITSSTTVAGIVHDPFGTTDVNTGLAATGTGKTGSYPLDGHLPTNVASSGSPTSAIGVYPTMTTINQGFNFNIQDMSSLTFAYGVGSGVTPPGDYFNPTCAGHF